jgi:hypothetical protein
MAAEEADDKSGIGVHYVDAYLKPMNLAQRTERRSCKRRGRIVSVGFKRGEG